LANRSFRKSVLHILRVRVTLVLVEFFCEALSCVTHGRHLSLQASISD